MSEAERRYASIPLDVGRAGPLFMLPAALAFALLIMRGCTGAAVFIAMVTAIIYLYLCTVGIAVTLPPFAVDPVWPASPHEWGLVLGIVFSSVTAQLLMNQGYFYCRGWEGGVFMSSELIFTALMGILFLDDPTGWRFWTGGGLILGSVVILNRLRNQAG